ncbi:MAG: DUF3078 domain-containing protein [Catalinimonas sp.]
MIRLLPYGLLIACLAASGGLLAQTAAPATDTSYWNRSFSFGVNFNQASFSGNWTAGGVNSIAVGSLLLAKADYERGPHSWENVLDMQYGVVSNEGQGFRKTADRLFFDSKYGRAISPKWDLFVATNFLTQFAQGFRYEENPQGGERARKISDLLAPAFLTAAWGFEFKPDDYFRLRLSPFSPRLTFVNDTTLYRNVPQNYGVEIGERVRYEWLAAQIMATYERTFNERLTVQSRYQLFANYETLAADAVDHRFDLSVAAQVTRFISVNLSTTVLYDIDQDSGVQLAQTLGIGFLITTKDD